MFYPHAKSRLEVVTQEENATPSNPNPNPNPNPNTFPGARAAAEPPRRVGLGGDGGAGPAATRARARRAARGCAPAPYYPLVALLPLLTFS